jgi:hypothetical protein
VIRIPQDHLTGLTKLALLPDDLASELREAIAKAVEKKKGSDISAEDIGTIGVLSRSDVDSIVEAVVGLNHAKTYYELSVDDFVEDVSEAIRESPEKLTDDVIAGVERRVREFLSIGQLVQYAKTNVLRYDHERTVHNLRILTDIRPVFGASVEEAPQIGVITHTLKIGYHHSLQRQDESFFAMDERDLQELKKAVERAEIKAKSIRKALSDSQIRIINQD